MSAAHEGAIPMAQEAQERLAGVLEGANPQMIHGALAEAVSHLDDMTICIDDANGQMNEEARHAGQLGTPA